MKKILTINPGSTSTKYKLFNAKGVVLDEQIFGLEEQKKESKFLSEIDGLDKIAIRVVHGGDILKTSKINKKIKNKIFEYMVFAPIHNRRALDAIEKIQSFFPRKSLYACFDTAFHGTISDELSSYMLPRVLVKKHKLKKYGFHGLAIESGLEKLRESKKEQGQKLPNKIIFAHLGGGCSITAVKNTKSFSTSMGLTPLSGVPMITRTGNIDPDIFSVLYKKGFSVSQVSDILNKESGFYGLTGSKDTKSIIEKAQKKSPAEKKAFDIFITELTKEIFAQVGLMQGVDAIVFSGGIGFGNTHVRREILKNLKILGITKNDMYIINVDEELVMMNKIKNLK